MTAWFSADQHLDHRNIIKYCHRPFKDAQEMDQVLLDNTLARVKKGDTLYLLGDLSLKVAPGLSFVDRVKRQGAELVYIRGNHDRRLAKVLAMQGIPVYDLLDISINGQHIVLCHYAMRVWNKSHFGSWQLHGHSHGTLPPAGKQWDVGVDNNNFRPVSFEEVARIMQTLPDNPNLIKEER